MTLRLAERLAHPFDRGMRPVLDLEPAPGAAELVAQIGAPSPAIGQALDEVERDQATLIDNHVIDPVHSDVTRARAVRHLEVFVLGQDYNFAIGDFLAPPLTLLSALTNGCIGFPIRTTLKPSLMDTRQYAEATDVGFP
jgi:hypothetical protein